MTINDEILRNKKVIRRLYEVINANDAAAFSQVVAPAFADNSNGSKGPEGFAAAAANLHRAYADLRIDVVDMLAEADHVAVRWHETGRHVAQFFNLKPTGKPFASRGMNIYRLAEGKIVESWLAIDPATIRAQQQAQAELASS
jgi:steroid delta-isomerase-like uncharacterized protein